MSGDIRHFTDLDVWQKSHELFLALVVHVEQFPRTRAGDILADQVLRSCGSIGANIAEGFNRSKKKFLNSLDIAIGEANETENWLLKVRDADYLPSRCANDLLEATKITARMLNRLISGIEQADSE